MTTHQDIELYPHNQETYDKIITAWQTQNRVATVQATGTGKSMLILKCLFTYPEGNKIVLAPSHHILNQLASKVDVLPNTTLMTYSKLSGMTEEEVADLNVNIIILDEFHRAGAESYGNGVDKLISTYPDAKILGTTATPIRYLDNGRDMSDELFDGNVVTNLSLPQAIVKEILPMPTYISALYTFEDEILNLNEKINKSSNSDAEKDDMHKQVEQMKKTLDKSKGIPVILQKHLGKASGKFIVFCRDKNHLFEVKNTVAEWFIKGKVNSEVVSYEVFTGNDEKDDVVVDQFRNAKVDDSIHLLFSINKLNEGLHVDDIDGVIFLRSTVSPIIYYQQLGRALKVGGNQPYVFDLVNNFNGIKSNIFAQELSETIESENIGRTSNNQEQLSIDDFTIYDEMQDVMELFGEIEGQLQSNWDAMFERYCSGEDSKEVTVWSKKQRQRFKAGQLNQNRIKQLNDANFIWEVLEESWNRVYMLLCKYKEEHGHLKIPTDTVIEGVKLGVRAHSLRKRHKEGALSLDKIKKLEVIGFDFDPHSDKWNRNYDLLCKYKSIHGHCNVPKGYIYRGVATGTWCNTQRQQYKQGKLSQERIAKLESIGFVWDTFDHDWNESYDLLFTYKSIHGHFNFPTKHEVDKINLRQWVFRQRQSYKKGKLSPERIAKLESIGFEWELKRGTSKTKQLQTV